MTNRVFRSTDTNAPVLTGQTGSLVALLSATLVDGYSIGTVSSITRVGTLATCTMSAAHGLVGTAKVTIAGATPSQYNGTYSVTPAGANAFTYTMASDPGASATGSPTARLDGAGWTKPYTSGSIGAAFKQGTGGLDHYIRVTDDGTGSASYARVSGATAMTAFLTISGQEFPVPASTYATPTTTGPAGLYFTKSNTADATARSWVMIATAATFTLIVNQTGTPTLSTTLHFGDFTPYSPTDTSHTLIVAQENTSYTNSKFTDLVAGLSTASPGKFAAASYTNAGGPVTLGSISPTPGTSGAGFGVFTQGFPALDGGLHLAPVMVNESVSAKNRGLLPRIWNPEHLYTLFTHLDIYLGSGPTAGRMYQMVHLFSASGVFLEISDT